jgi:hypothetical protein
MKLCDDALTIGREYLCSGGGFDVCRSVFQSTALAQPNPAATQLRDRDFAWRRFSSSTWWGPKECARMGLANRGDGGIRFLLGLAKPLRMRPLRFAVSDCYRIFTFG